MKQRRGFDVIAKIGEISSPRISMEWLVRGIGDMLSRLVGLVEAKDKQLAEKDKQINTLLEIIKAK